MVPLMIGARDMAFPRLNALSFWLFLFGGIAFYVSIFFTPPSAGWTMYAPLSDNAYMQDGGTDAWIFMIHLTGISSLVGAINFVATIHNMRAKGMGWGRMPLFVWTVLIYSYLLILALPAIAAAVTMLLTDRHFGTAFFDPTGGGRPAPVAAPVLVLRPPRGLHHGAAGVRDDLRDPAGIRPKADLRLQGDRGLDGGDRVPRHARVGAPHVRHAARRVVLAFFMLSSFAIAVPTGIKIFNWLATLWRGQIVTKTPLYFACGFLATFVIGGVSGVILAIFPVDWQLTDTYFVVAHLHYVLFGGSVFAIFGGLYYWFPKMSGRMLSEGLGKLSFWLMLIGFNLTFLIQHSLGMSGHAAAHLPLRERAAVGRHEPDLDDRLVGPRHRRARDAWSTC